MAHGVNYYDTAYIYHGGKSEIVLGRALSKYPRDSFYIADKFNVQANSNYEAQFSEQLTRLQTEYIDFYLLHGITDLTARDYEACGCIPYFQEQKRMGKISYLGFSFHGTPHCLRELLKDNCWDFVQIQLNYYDWYQGTAKQQYEIFKGTWYSCYGYGACPRRYAGEFTRRMFAASPENGCFPGHMGTSVCDESAGCIRRFKWYVRYAAD